MSKGGDLPAWVDNFGLPGKIVDVKQGKFGFVLVVDLGECRYPRHVCYKMPKDGHYPEDQLDQFIREARIWFRIGHHPLVLRPLYVTSFQSRPLICMPYCDTNLREFQERLPKERLDLVGCLVITAQILKALDFMQGKATAHQDLKPENVLLTDLSRKNKNWPPEGVNGVMRYGLRVADFGLANAWQQLGKPQGTFPYMAPEQFEPSRYAQFLPDIFATGVIVAEFLTGKHPCGKITRQAHRDWNQDKWRLWAQHGQRKIEVDSSPDTKDLVGLLKQLLDPQPEARPSIHQALEDSMRMLHKADEKTYAQLDLNFEYYDALAAFEENDTWLTGVAEVAKLSQGRNSAIEELEREREAIQPAVADPAQLFYWSKVSYLLGELLSARNTEDDPVRAEKIGREILSIAMERRPLLKAEYCYRLVQLRGETVIPALPSSDFEVFADMVGKAKTLLERTVGVAVFTNEINSLDPATQSAFFFLEAVDLHSVENGKADVRMLEKCISINPQEATFYYFKALWLEQQLALLAGAKNDQSGEFKDMLSKFGLIDPVIPLDQQSEAIKADAVAAVRKAIELAPKGDESHQLYEKLKEQVH